MGCSVYILRSQKNGSLYVGSSENPLKRLEYHNTGSSIYTSRNVPYKLVFSQEFENTSKARIAEMKLKSWKRKDFLEKIIKEGKIKCQDK
jgi:putative endonuclease